MNVRINSDLQSYALFDGAEYRRALCIKHLDAYHIAVTQPRCTGRGERFLFIDPCFGNAAMTGGRIAIRYRAAADDGAGAKGAGACGMGDELRVSEEHVDAGVRAA